MNRILRILLTASALFGTVSRLIVPIPGSPRWDPLLYFTVQSNLMVCAFLLADSAARAKACAGKRAEAENRGAALPDRPAWHAVHGAVLLAISMTGLVYNVLLAPGIDAAGYDAVIIFVNHTVTPALFVIDWLVRQRQYAYRTGLIFPWLAYPAAYLVFGILEGTATGHFRYPFLDYTSQDGAHFAAGLALMVGFFVLTSRIIISLNRRMAHPS